jgi:Tfp pilus assembly protein PilV
LPTNGVYLSASDTLDLTTAGGKAFELSATKHAAWQGSAPTLSSCGASPKIDANATDSSGQVTEGSGTATSCTIRFANAYSSYVHCRVTPETADIAGFGYSYTTSAITVAGISLTSAVFDYACDGK